MKKKRMLLCLLSAGMMWMPMTVIATTATSSSRMTAAAPEDDQVITGTIEDDLGPLIGATVKVQGTSNGTLTDMDGKFRLNCKPGQYLPGQALRLYW